jgi:prenyltransferase beta subunit
VRLAIATVAVALAASPADYVASHQQPDGGFAEPGGPSDPALTAWAVLGLVAAGRDPGTPAADYLTGQPASGATEIALRVLALRALGQDANTDVARLEALRRRDGRVGPLVNSTIWSVLALRAAGRPVATSIRYLVRTQHRSGGWAWYPRGAPDSNDTAAAVEALRAGGLGARSRPIRRALSYLRRLQHADGGFSLVRGRASDAQSTAWAIQAFVAARREPGAPSFRFLARLRRPDGSYRYSKLYAATPVWVTSQVLPALARRPFPLR